MALTAAPDTPVYCLNFYRGYFGNNLPFNWHGPLKSSTNKVKALIKLVVNFEIIPIPDGLTVVS